jgi:hypothetical protein
MKKSELKQLIKEEISKILNENNNIEDDVWTDDDMGDWLKKSLESHQNQKNTPNQLGTKIDKQGNIIYSLYDENSDWDFSDGDTFMITWTLDKDVPNRRVQRKFEWDDEDFNIEIPIKDIINFYKNPTKSSENFKAPGGYVSISKKEANDIIDSYYENWPDEINPDLN